MPTAIFVCVSLSLSLRVRCHLLCCEVKCNLMLICVASCISKVRRWQRFVWKPYISAVAAYCFCTVGHRLRQRTKSFNMHIVRAFRLMQSRCAKQNAAFVAFHRSFILLQFERKCTGNKLWKITWHLINELVWVFLANGNVCAPQMSLNESENYVSWHDWSRRQFSHSARNIAFFGCCVDVSILFKENDQMRFQMEYWTTAFKTNLILEISTAKKLPCGLGLW